MSDFYRNSVFSHQKNQKAHERQENFWKIIAIGLNQTEFSHSLSYKQTKNLRAIQILLGHSKLESTVRYLGVEIDDALELSEHIDMLNFSLIRVVIFKCIVIYLALHFAVRDPI